MEWDNTSFADIRDRLLAKKWWLAAVATALLLGLVAGVAL